MKKKNKFRRVLPAMLAAAMLFSLAACGDGATPSASTGSATASAGSTSASGGAFKKGTSTEEIVKTAAEAGMVGNWGLGNEYEEIGRASCRERV